MKNPKSDCPHCGKELSNGDFEHVGFCYYKKDICKKLTWVWVFLVLGLMAVLVASQGWLYMPEIDKPEVWFQRSGSILILAIILAELWMLKTMASISQTGEFEAREHYKKQIVVTHWAAISLGLIGTMIWGYGDLIFKILI